MNTKGVFTQDKRRPRAHIVAASQEDTRLLARNILLGGILFVALLAFELFNFDTTRFALRNLLGEVYFWHVHWATILAIAFCAIDFAGLARLFTPQRKEEAPREVWYLMGAWLLGATMNAVMTWWAVSLTLLSHDFGNEVLTRAQLLRWVPFFIAALVWLTRILFIGALSVAGGHMFARAGMTDAREYARQKQRGQQPGRKRPIMTPARGESQPETPAQPQRKRPPATPRRRPPQPGRPVGGTGRGNRTVTVGLQAQQKR